MDNYPHFTRPRLFRDHVKILSQNLVELIPNFQKVVDMANSFHLILFCSPLKLVFLITQPVKLKRTFGG